MIIPTLLPFLLATISVLCFIIYRELKRSCDYFIVRNNISIRTCSLDKLFTKSIIINNREIKLDKAFFRYYTILVDGNDLYLIDLNKKAKCGDIILPVNDSFIKDELNYVIDNKFCGVLSSNTNLKSNNIDYFIRRHYLPKDYYVLDLKTKIKPGRI